MASAPVVRQPDMEIPEKLTQSFTASLWQGAKWYIDGVVFNINPSWIKAHRLTLFLIPLKLQVIKCNFDSEFARHRPAVERDDELLRRSPSHRPCRWRTTKRLGCFGND
jgi:hypothetical protein